jgi:bacteriorhodopsin
MADIDVVRKRRTMTWLWWVIAVIAVAIVLSLIINGNRTTTRSAPFGSQELGSRASALLVPARSPSISH